MTLITLGAISTLTSISVWLIVEDEFVVVVADVVLRITATKATNKIFVNSISEETKDKKYWFVTLLKNHFNIKNKHISCFWKRQANMSSGHLFFHLMLQNLVFAFHSYLFPSHPLFFFCHISRHQYFFSRRYAKHKLRFPSKPLCLALYIEKVS